MGSSAKWLLSQAFSKVFSTFSGTLLQQLSCIMSFQQMHIFEMETVACIGWRVDKTLQ